MKLENIKQIRNLIGIEISDSLKDVGTPNLKILCDMASFNDTLIKRLEDPERASKLDKQLNSKLWKD